MTTDLSDRELVLTRTMPFPRPLVWTAMTDPAHVNNWWGPDGFSNEDVSLDFRVGGVWSFVMVGPDGRRYPNRTVFKAIEAPARLVMDVGDNEKVWFEMTVTLEEVDGGTHVRLRQLYETRDFRDAVLESSGAVEGGKQHLAKLEAYVREHLGT